VLQALAYTPPLANYLRRGEHSKSCRVRTAKTPDQFCLFCALEQTCNSMAAAKHSAIQPRLIVNHLRAISRSFRLGRQEDSHEFLRFVMEMLQKNDLAAYGGSALVKDIRIQETTALFGIFGGYFRSQVRCLSCQYRSNTYDAFLDLSLELAHVSSVAQALASFTRPEKLDADNLYNCSQCKRKVRAEKQLTIFKAPTVLCVHLKRFQFAQQFGGKINKVRTEAHASTAEPFSLSSLFAFALQPGRRCLFPFPPPARPRNRDAKFEIRSTTVAPLLLDGVRQRWRCRQFLYPDGLQSRRPCPPLLSHI